MLIFLEVQEALDDRMTRKMFICRQSETSVSLLDLNQLSSSCQHNC